MREKIHHLLNDDSEDARIYGQLMTVIIVLSLLPLCFKDAPAWLDAIDWFCVIVFILDYIARWSTADLKLGKGKASFIMYPFTPMAIVDLLSILPAFVALNPAFRTLRVLRLSRAIRSFKLIRYSKSATAIVQAILKQKNALLIVLGLAVVYVMVSAILVFNVEPDTFDTFFDAVYWAVVSLTTVGYGDLYPTTEVGRAVAMVSSFMGIAIVALPASIITAGFLEELKTKDSEEEIAE